MKKQVKNSSRKNDYTYIEKNIYKVDNRYRVRVGKDSLNAITLKQARAAKKILKGNLQASKIW